VLRQHWIYESYGDLLDENGGEDGRDAMYHA
jgi:hypothetical protein